MRRASRIFLFVCIIALVAMVIWAPNSEAYQTYSAQKDVNDNPTGNCVTCHGDFDAASYISRNDGTAWQTSLHVGHRAGMLNRDCNTCHLGDFSTRYPVSLNLSNGGTGFDPISCVGCHGREEDLNTSPTQAENRAAGLRQHHTNAGAAFCGGCHSDNDPATFIAAGESAAPSYYFTPDAVHADKPTDPCNANAGSIGQESVFGSIGLDNDGDLLYDGIDPDCVPCEVDADCDNGVFCDGAETCDTATGTCLPGTPPTCDDGVGCTDDSCDPALDDCLNIPNDGNCGDNNVCNGAETCDPVNDCQPGEPLVCDDGDLCTIDSCDPVAGCVFTPVECAPGEQCDPADGICKPEAECAVDADCDDGLFCNGAETCDTATGTCQAGTPPDCDDGVGCTVDTCDEVNDTCASTPDDASCDDGDVCNGIETCDPVNDCQPGEPLVCDDGDLCTIDSCDPVAGCVFTPVECAPGEQCDPADGICKPEAECAVDADCDDGEFCNGAETCDTATGECLPGTPPDCDDGVDCTVDTCDEVNDTCVNTPDDTACPDDGLFCTGDEICDPVAGCVSTGDPCPEGQVCNEETDMCDMVVAEKVTLCHKGKKTIIIGAEAVAAHLRHGDTLGLCP